MLSDLFCLQHLKLGWWAPIRESLKSDFDYSSLSIAQLQNASGGGVFLRLIWKIPGPGSGNLWDPHDESMNMLIQSTHLSVQFSHSVVSDSVTSWTAAHQASLSITNSWSFLKLMSIKLLMTSNPLILCYPLLLLPSIVPSIRVFSSESVLHIR